LHGVFGSAVTTLTIGTTAGAIGKYIFANDGGNSYVFAVAGTGGTEVVTRLDPYNYAFSNSSVMTRFTTLGSYITG
jgi:hypothetical protein